MPVIESGSKPISEMELRFNVFKVKWAGLDF